MLRVGVLVSGGGTNLQAIFDAIDSGRITNAEVAVVISNNAGAYALERAKNRGVEAVCLSRSIRRCLRKSIPTGWTWSCWPDIW